MTNKEKNKHIEQPDDFSLRVKEKLDDFSMPVDLDIWANIAPHITPQVAPPRNRKWITWVSSAAAIAAIVTVVFLILPNKEPISTIAESHKNEQNIVSPEKETRETLAEEQQSKPAEKPATTVARPQRAFVADNIPPTANERENKGEENNTPTAVLLSDNNNELPLVANKDDYENENKESNEKENIEKAKEDVITPTKGLKTNQQAEPKLLVPRKSQSNNNWLLAASMSSSSGISSGMDMSALKATNYDPEFLSDKNKEPITLTDPGNANTSRLTTEDFSDIEHETPLSFGITVRKDLNDRIGIETGLVYTYLSSKMERTNVPQYKAKQELHYLGVPLNVVVYLWNNPKWNIYISGGGMIEKGLSQKYTQEMFQGNDLASSTTDKGSVDGVQLSLSASAGVSYAFYQNLSLYVEPRYSYYFDNDQPFSIRTDKRNVFGVGGGLRIKF